MSNYTPDPQWMQRVDKHTFIPLVSGFCTVVTLLLIYGAYKLNG